MIVATILFKTWQPAKVPGRLVVNDDGIMYNQDGGRPVLRMGRERTSSKRRGLTPEERQQVRQNFGAQARSRLEAQAATTAQKIIDFLISHPQCTAQEIVKGVGMSTYTVKVHTKRLHDSGRLKIEKFTNLVGGGWHNVYTWQEAA